MFALDVAKEIFIKINTYVEQSPYDIIIFSKELFTKLPSL